jgi:hypothetical protein
VETRRLGSVSQDTGRPRSDLGILIPGPDHGFKILRSGNLSRARHTSPPGKRGEADLKNDLQPVPATTRTRLHLPSRKPTFQEVQNPPCQIETPTWQASSRPNPAFRKNQKNNLFRSDTTDPEARPFTRDSSVWLGHFIGPPQQYVVHLAKF